MRPSTGRRPARRRRSAPPSWRGGRRASIPIRKNLRAHGGWSEGLRLRCRARSANRGIVAGARRSGALPLPLRPEAMRVVFRCDPTLADGLIRPMPARQALPEWLRAMPRTAYSQTHGQDVRTVKQCPPFVDAMAHGFIIPLPCDVRVHDGVLSWDWDRPALSIDAHPQSPMSFHVPEQVTGTPFFDHETAIVKFNSFW